MKRRLVLIVGFLVIMTIDLVGFADLSSFEWRRWVPAIILIPAAIAFAIRYEMKERDTKRERVKEEDGSLLPLIATFLLILGLQVSSGMGLVSIRAVVFLQPALLMLALWLGLRSPPPRQQQR